MRSAVDHSEINGFFHFCKEGPFRCTRGEGVGEKGAATLHGGTDPGARGHSRGTRKFHGAGGERNACANSSICAHGMEYAGLEMIQIFPITMVTGYNLFLTLKMKNVIDLLSLLLSEDCCKGKGFGTEVGEGDRQFFRIKRVG